MVDPALYRLVAKVGAADGAGVGEVFAGGELCAEGVLLGHKGNQGGKTALPFVEG